MKRPIAIGIIFIAQLIPVHSRDVEEVEIWRIEQFEQMKWKSLSFGTGSWHGDYYSQNESILLQKLPDDDRVLLSSDAGGLPVAKLFLSKEEAEIIRRRVAKLHRIALTEEGKGEYTEMLLTVTPEKGDTVSASTRFDSTKSTMQEFYTYMHQLLHPQ